ncbi:hypothetical protein PENSPDRAFT_592351 [Peniophora sp. CONT]|nr:hypothetical protein PENSPDRAFT_592351 [Peniophora sp. CONT]
MRRFATATLAVLAATANAQDIKFDSEHNATTIIGSWASGSRNVTTGSGFADPTQMTFTYPAVSGVAYAFSEDYYYELSRYRFISNGSRPDCVTGTLVWAHGKYDLLNNGSIVLTPLGDGYQQVQSACEDGTNIIQDYNYTELFQSWRIFMDPTDGPKLHLFEFDGTPVAPLFQTSTTPVMLPTEKLRNTTSSSGTTVLNNNRSFMESCGEDVVEEEERGVER